MTTPDRFEINSREPCMDCEDPLLPGDLVRKTAAGLVHDRCPSDKETL